MKGSKIKGNNRKEKTFPIFPYYLSPPMISREKRACAWG